MVLHLWMGKFLVKGLERKHEKGTSVILFADNKNTNPEKYNYENKLLYDDKETDCRVMEVACSKSWESQVDFVERFKKEKESKCYEPETLFVYIVGGEESGLSKPVYPEASPIVGA